MGLLEFSDQGLILVLADFLIEPELFQDHAAPPVEPPLGFARVGRDGAWNDGRQADNLLQGKLENIPAEIMARGGHSVVIYRSLVLSGASGPKGLLDLPWPKLPGSSAPGVLF